MRTVRVACAALNQTPLDWEGNRRNILGAIQEARAAHVAVLCLPELCLTGYGCEDMFLAPGVQKTALEELLAIVPETHDVAVSIGLPLYVEDDIFDAVALVADGKLLGFVCKQFLCREGLHYEPRWFSAWAPGRKSKITVGGKQVPVGDLVFEFGTPTLGDIRLGFEICEDAWSANRPGARLSRHAVDLILNPSASHFGFLKLETRKRFVLEGSRAYGAAYLYANLLGNEAGRAIYDGTCLVATGGDLVALGQRFSFHDRKLTYADIDLDLVRVGRQRSFDAEAQGEIISATSSRIVRTSARWIAAPTSARAAAVNSAWEDGTHIKEEEFARAVALGMFDYMRKCRARGFVLSLSGGADSATVACLVRLLVRFGVSELGLAAFISRLPYYAELNRAKSELDLVRMLLVCVYQSAANSGPVTRRAAEELSRALGAEFAEINVENIVEGYEALVAKVVGRPLTWEQDDIALQNIQARVRGPGVWLLANIRGALLVPTSNRSEAAVGYATMDGDTCGGLSPLAGVDKSYIREWLRWLEHEAPESAEPVPALRLINEQAPTAELRPAARVQTDEADLMPYVVLDRIERLFVRDKRFPVEIFALIAGEFTQFDHSQLAVWVERFFTLWAANQWKRERYAPSFHLDDMSVDPRAFLRFPILSGGFRKELAQLREVAKRPA